MAGRGSQQGEREQHVAFLRADFQRPYITHGRLKSSDVADLVARAERRCERCGASGRPDIFNNLYWHRIKQHPRETYLETMFSLDQFVFLLDQAILPMPGYQSAGLTIRSALLLADETIQMPAFLLDPISGFIDPLLIQLSAEMEPHLDDHPSVGRDQRYGHTFFRIIAYACQIGAAIYEASHLNNAYFKRVEIIRMIRNLRSCAIMLRFICPRLPGEPEPVASSSSSAEEGISWLSVSQAPVPPLLPLTTTEELEPEDERSQDRRGEEPRGEPLEELSVAQTDGWELSEQPGDR